MPHHAVECETGCSVPGRVTHPTAGSACTSARSVAILAVAHAREGEGPVSVWRVMTMAGRLLSVKGSGAEPLRDDLYRVDNTPGSCAGSADDVVKAVAGSDGVLWAIERVEWSGRHTVRVIVLREGPLHGEPAEVVRGVRTARRVRRGRAAVPHGGARCRGRRVAGTGQRVASPRRTRWIVGLRRRLPQ
jgi:hypothetical protein